MVGFISLFLITFLYNNFEESNGLYYVKNAFYLPYSSSLRLIVNVHGDSERTPRL